MDRKKISGGVSAIVPAYNEATRIANALDVLTTYPGFEEVIVIDDGSKDDTGAVAAKYPVRYYRNESNRGKGYSMERGVQLAKGNVIFFCDADIRGLKHSYLDTILAPVLNGEVDMLVAARDRKIHGVPFIADFNPISGERAITKEMWELIPDYYKKNFRIETGMNLYAKYFGTGLKTVVCKGLMQTIKEKKYGFIVGAWQRWRMNVDLITANLRILFWDSFRILKMRKMSVMRFILFWLISLVRISAINVSILISWPVIVLLSPLWARNKNISDMDTFNDNIISLIGKEKTSPRENIIFDFDDDEGSKNISL